MDGGDVMEVEVYKKREEHCKGDQRKKKIRRKNIERRE